MLWKLQFPTFHRTNFNKHHLNKGKTKWSEMYHTFSHHDTRPFEKLQHGYFETNWGSKNCEHIPLHNFYRLVLFATRKPRRRIRCFVFWKGFQFSPKLITKYFFLSSNHLVCAQKRSLWKNLSNKNFDFKSER